MKLFVVVFLLFVTILYAQEDTDGVLCSAKYCADYTDENPCQALPDNCKIQNSTNNGVFFPSPEPCNCCQHCIANLNEGDYCAKGQAGGSVPDTICGPGLTCSDEGLCVKMDTVGKTTCTAAQANYDQRRFNGTIGTLETRPNCDRSGFYEPYKCISGLTCFCVDTEGNRIFGEIPFTTTAHLILRCQCSRKYREAVGFLDLGRELHPNEYFRCTENGDYDTIQCIGDGCMCTDALDGAPTFPTADFVNITDISKETLKDCFDSKIHETGKYYHVCAEKYLKLLNELNEFKEAGYDVVFDMEEFPNCGMDGKYAPVQKDFVKGIAYCVDPDGNKIEEYSALIEEADNMDCNCARTSLLLNKTEENPVCCSNGNFKPVQCRRNICYCVDNDGYELIPSTDDDVFEADRNDVESLTCTKECPA